MVELQLRWDRRYLVLAAFFGVVPALGDASKSLSKITKLISKNFDKADEIAELLVTLEKTFPDELPKMIPDTAAETIIRELKEGDLKVSRKYYDDLTEICVKLGKEVPSILDDFPDAKRVVASENVWVKGWFKRGRMMDDLLGNNLGRTYKTYDVFDKNSYVVTSIKSLDPRCVTYQDASKLESALKRYGNQLMDGKNTVKYNEKEYQIKARKLELALPDVSLTKEQKKIIADFIIDNKSKFEVQITIVS